MSNNVKVTGNLDVVGTATGASLDVSGALQGATVTADATTNQLVLGTTNTTTISSTAPAASRVVTLHDAGAASNIVLDTAEALTITNAGSTGQVLTKTGATTASFQTSTGGTAAVYTVLIPVSSAEVKTLFSVGKELVAAPGAGFAIMPIFLYTKFNYIAPQYTGGGSLLLNYTGTSLDPSGGGTVFIFSDIRGAVNNVIRSWQPAGVMLTGSENRGLTLKGTSTDYATGNGTLSVSLSYVIFAI